VQKAGVLATAKHFPGFRELAADPALTDTVREGSLADLSPGLEPFRAVIDAGVGAVMLLGPANVVALDVFEPDLSSERVVRLLRGNLGSLVSW
jgi:beta-N-acetylhexosaminidase